MEEIPDDNILNAVDKVTSFRFLKVWNSSLSTRQNINNKTNPFDNGGVTCTKQTENTLEIEHSEYTDVDSVGLQMWHGAILLADFVIHEGNLLFANKNVMELSSGTGFVSIVVAMYCERVVCTDIKEANVLETINKNFERNRHLISATYSVKELNFFKDYSADVLDIISRTDIILVSEVIYDNQITDGFINTLVKILTRHCGIIVYITMEKRYVFTLQNLRVEAKHYDYFFQILNRIAIKLNWQLEQLSLNDIPNYFFEYERNKQLELWRISNK